jgi:hypothetical protein
MTDTKPKIEPGANFESVQVRTAERARFDAFMAKHVAQLMGHSAPFTARLPALERELFLARALAAAWDKREEFVAGKENAGLLIWWDKCLRVAALSRGTWHQVYQDDVRTIRGVDLGR